MGHPESLLNSTSQDSAILRSTQGCIFKKHPQVMLTLSFTLRNATLKVVKQPHYYPSKKGHLGCSHHHPSKKGLLGCSHHHPGKERTLQKSPAMKVGLEGQVRVKSGHISLRHLKDFSIKGTVSPFGREASPCQVPCMILTREQPKQKHGDPIFLKISLGISLVSLPRPDNCSSHLWLTV